MRRYIQAVVLSLTFALHVCGAPVRADAKAANTEIEHLLGSTKVSCSTMVIAEYSTHTFLTTGAAVRIPFAASDCAAKVGETTSRSLLAPVMLATTGVTDQEVGLKKETKTEREIRIENQELAHEKILDGLQTNFKSLFAACNALGQRPNPNATRVCYLGAPAAGSSGPFRAAFQAMLTNTLPQNESLCAPEKIVDWNMVEPEFMPFRDHFGSTFSWPIIRQSLEQDGFRCGGEDGDYCSRMVLGVAPKASHGGPVSDGLSSTSLGAILPRMMRVYKGDWFQLGPPSFRCREEVGKLTAKCPKSKPVRGERSGVCLVGEDWHMWAMFLGLFNRFEE